METYEIITSVSAIWAALATTGAVIATFKAPTMAARMTAALNEALKESHDRRSQKMSIFLALMRDRAHLVTIEATRALNLIDVVYADSDAVRDAWHQLYGSFDKHKWKAEGGKRIADEKIVQLLNAMAKDLNLSGALSTVDFERIYLPGELLEEIEAKRVINRGLLGEQYKPPPFS